MDTQNKKYILFDLDGTLTDPGLGITNSVMYALKKFGIDVKDRTELYKFIGPPLSQSFEVFYGFTPEMALQAVDTYREYFSVKGLYENTVFDGIEQLLSRLKQEGKILCLATSKPEKFAKEILQHFNLEKYFDFIAGSMMNGDRTDKAEVIEWVLHNLQSLYGEGVASQAIMIGDREHDIIGAHKNHIPALGVLFGYGSVEELEQAGAEGIVDKVETLETYLCQQFKRVEGRPKSCEGRLEKEIRVYDLLDELGVSYERIDHEEANTMEACKAIDECLQATVCKNLFLCNSQKTKFYLLMMPGSKTFKTKELSAQIQSARLSFASPEYMLKYLDITPGSVSVMGLMNDSENHVRLLIDADVLKGEYIGFHPCINTSSLRVQTKDLLERIIPAMHHEMTIVELGKNNE